jgi:uncharacterized protein GlcG (DUF336 family)
MDGAIRGGVLVAPQKARSAALYKRPTKAFEEAITPGGVGVRFLRLEGAVPIEGGLPLVIDNKIIGAIGMSGDCANHSSMVLQGLRHDRDGMTHQMGRPAYSY